MAIVQGVIERKLSSLLGAKVTFEKFSVSPLSGTIEAAGVRVGGDEGAQGADPLLTIVLVRAQVSIKQAFKGEIVVKSITVEKPVLSFAPEKLPPRPQAGEESSAKDDKTSWKFDIQKLFLIDGQITARVSGFELSSGRVLLDLNRVGQDYSLTFLAEDVRRTDRAVMIGTVGATGRIMNVADLTKFADASASVEVTLGDLGRLAYTTPRIRSMQGEVELHGKITLAQITALFLPPVRD
jgi:hypothetical protein